MISIDLINSFFARLRAFLLKPFFQKMGKKVYIREGVRFTNPKNISLGNTVYINYNCTISAHRGKIRIGNDVSIGYNASIITTNHRFTSRKIPINRQGDQENTFVIIEDDVWIGAHAIILPNVKIGRGSVIAAGAVITKSVLAYSVMAGVPAKRIKKRR